MIFNSQIKIDCITVNTTPVKGVIDDHIQRLFDALLNSLRKSISSEVNTIDTFLKEAMETLSQRPQSVEEIGTANAKHAEFMKTKKEVSIVHCTAIIQSNLTHIQLIYCLFLFEMQEFYCKVFVASFSLQKINLTIRKKYLMSN